MPNESVHRIRLKGPWQICPPNGGDESFQQHAMPADWRSLFGDVAGMAVYRRKFHTPSGLEVGDRVLIHIPNGVGQLEQFQVNGISIGPCSKTPLKFDVTSQLQDFNQLQFKLTFDPLESPDVPGGLWETVFVEIHAQQLS